MSLQSTSSRSVRPTRQTTFVAPNIPYGISTTIRRAVEAADHFAQEDDLLRGIYQRSDCKHVQAIRDQSKQLYQLIDDVFLLFHTWLRLLDLIFRYASTTETSTADEKEQNRVEIYSFTVAHVDKLQSHLDRLRIISVAFEIVALWVLQDSEPYQNQPLTILTLGGGHDSSRFSMGDLRDLAIRIVGNTSENQARVQRLHTRIAAIPIFSSSVNQLRDYWVEQYTYYVYLSEAWGVAGNRNHKDKVSAGWIVYSLASTSIEQIHPTLLTFPHLFYNTGIRFSRQRVPEQVATMPQTWNLGNFGIQFPTRLLQNSHTPAATPAGDHNISAAIVDIVRTGSTKYDLYLSVTAQRSITSRFGRTSRCKSIGITWLFEYPDGTPSNSKKPNILAFWPSQQKSYESRTKVSKRASGMFSLNVQPLGVSIGDVSFQRTGKVIIPDWARIEGVDLCHSNGVEEVQGVRWFVTENATTERGSDRCVVSVSLELAKPAHEIFTEVHVKVCYTEKSWLKMGMSQNVNIDVKGSLDINLLCLQTKAILSRSPSM
ncbi:hypothetical protein BJ165DRAFT_1521624 [Panaeolus papilionaceus]|nr:hypothetical protein BJ165DRAFT_1521624 [Panaeolus papilionaceus]